MMKKHDKKFNVMALQTNCKITKKSMEHPSVIQS